MEQVLSWVKLAIQVLSCVTVIIPLGYKLYNTIVAYGKEKNWPKLVGLVAVYMAEAEKKLSEGADRKAWVMAMIQTTAKQMDYELTEVKLAEISQLIDDLCAMAKQVNVNVLPIEGEEPVVE